LHEPAAEAAASPRLFLLERRMKNLQDATEMICDLKGTLVAFDAVIAAWLQQLAPEARDAMARSFAVNAELARTVLVHSSISEVTVAAFERDVARMSSLMAHRPEPARE